MLTQFHLGSPLIGELPSSSPAARAGTAAADGFTPGILSPTEILVIGPGVARQTAALARLQHELAAQPGVAEIAGPASLPRAAAQLNPAQVNPAQVNPAQVNPAQVNPAQVNPAQVNPAQVNPAQVNPMLAASGGAARFVVVETTDPLDATAISRVQQLQARLPALARAAGLPAARFELAGQTALTGDSIGSVFADLGRVALTIMAVTLYCWPCSCGRCSRRCTCWPPASWPCSPPSG